MSLSALQHDFQAWLTTGSEDAAVRFPSDAQPGLQVYQNNYRASLMACLEESFAQTLAWIGSDAFRAAAARAIDARPPDSWSLDHYAAHFPAALAQAFPDDLEVAELASLELALTDAFVGTDAEPLIAAHLPQIDWDRAILRWVPTARLLTLRTNAPAIWSAFCAGDVPPSAIISAAPIFVLVWRQEETTCFRSLEPLEAEMAAKLFKGIGFAELCEHLVSVLGETDGVQTAGAWLGRWVAEGLLVAPEPTGREIGI